jgi:hypothetical protein
MLIVTIVSVNMIASIAVSPGVCDHLVCALVGHEDRHVRRVRGCRGVRLSGDDHLRPTKLVRAGVHHQHSKLDVHVSPSLN